jgi:F-type H+-transporting ATPase subunit b
VNRLQHLQAAVFAAVVVAATRVHAAGGGAAGDHHEAHFSDINWWTMGDPHRIPLGWLTITFVIFAAIVVTAAKKPLLAHLNDRADRVKTAIEEATRAKEQALARAKDAEERLAALGAEVARMKSDFEAQGRAEADRIERVAHEAAARIQKDAEDTIVAESQRATQVLQQEAARLALEIAELKIKAALQPQDDARLQQSLVQDLHNETAAKAARAQA